MPKPTTTGALCFIKGMYSEALADYTKAIEIEPDNGEAFFYWG